MESVTPMAIGALGSWETVRAAANLASSASSTPDIITVPPGQAYKLSVEYTPASATSASDTVTLYPCGSAGTAAANSAASLTSAHAATTAIVLSPFGQIPEGVWAVIVTAGAVGMNSLAIKKQRVK